MSSRTRISSLACVSISSISISFVTNLLITLVLVNYSIHLFSMSSACLVTKIIIVAVRYFSSIFTTPLAVIPSIYYSTYSSLTIISSSTISISSAHLSHHSIISSVIILCYSTA